MGGRDKTVVKQNWTYIEPIPITLFQTLCDDLPSNHAQLLLVLLRQVLARLKGTVVVALDLVGMGIMDGVDGLASGVGDVRNVCSLSFRLLLGLLDVGGMAVDCLGNVAVDFVALLLQLMVQLVALGLQHRLLHLVGRLHGLLLGVQVRHHQGVDVLLLVAVAMALLVEVIKVVVVPVGVEVVKVMWVA